MILQFPRYFGALDVVAEMTTEKKITSGSAAILEAYATSYETFHQSEMAAAKDIQGKTQQATDHYDDAIAKAAEARDKWKQAEYKQTELLTHLVSLPKNAAAREEFRKKIDDIDEEEFLSNLQSSNRFPAFIDVGEIGNMIAFSRQILDIDTDELGIEKIIDPNDSPIWHELLSLSALGIHQIRNLKITSEELRQTLEEHCSNAAESKMLESHQSSVHLYGVHHPTTKVSSKLFNELISYAMFLEVLHFYTSEALMEAPDDKPDIHLEEYCR